MTSLRFALAALALGRSAAVLAAPAEGPNPTFTGRDLFDLSAATDPQISPDGRTIAYVRRSADIMTDKARSSIWLIDVATGEQRPLAAGTGDHFNPRWSPDGRRLAYASTAEGGAPQLFVRWMDSGETVAVTGLPDSPQALAWSPDGRRIAYLMNVPDEGPEARLGAAQARGRRPGPSRSRSSTRSPTAPTAPAISSPASTRSSWSTRDGGAPRQLTFGAYHDGAPEWTPDGRAILFSAVRKPDWELDRPRQRDLPARPRQRRADRADHPRRARRRARSLARRPDDRLSRLRRPRARAFEQSHIYVMSADGRRAAAASHPASTASIDQIEWAADGRSLFAAYEEDGSVTVSPDRPRRQRPADRPRRRRRPASTGPMPAAGSASRAAARSPSPSARSTARPMSPSPSAAARRQLTRLNELTLSAKNLGTLRDFEATAPDGGRVPSWILLPPTWQAGPARARPILEIHGGPYAAYGPHFSTDYQLYAAAGYAVLYTNPRGSTGYGQAFADGIEKTYPASNYDDLMAAVDAAVAAGFADPDNLFVTGGSGGGILTAWIDRQDRPLQGRGVAEAGDQLDQHGADQRTALPFFGPYWIGAQPWENYQSYWARSPLSLMANVKTPTLVVVGGEDYRTPVSEAEQLYSALKLRRVPTALVKVPGASHGGLTGAAVAVGGQGGGDHRLVRQIPDRKPKPAAAASAEPLPTETAIRRSTSSLRRVRRVRIRMDGE